MPLRFSRLWLGGVVLALPVDLHAEDKPQLRAYDLGQLDLETTARAIRAILSPRGTVVEDPAHHRLIVLDRPDVHAQVAAALRQLAVPARNIRIAVSYRAETDDRLRGLEAAGRARVGDVTVGAGRQPPPSGLEVRGEDSTRHGRSRAQQQLLVLSGGRASLQVAESVPYVEWLRTWGEPYGLWAAGVQWQDVGSSLVVEPLALGDGSVRLRLTPAFSHLVDRQRRITEVRQLSTEVVVRPGEEVDLGGLSFQDQQFKERFFLGLREGSRVERVGISVRATVE